jgi:NADH-dependent peroxiredoxin subunit F
MLDETYLQQLRTVFATLENDYTFLLSPSTHADFTQMQELLSGVASTSPRLSVSMRDTASPVPHFSLLKNGKPTGVAFHGTPGGHEFTSFIVAILHADGKGKRPDEQVIARIKNLRGPVRLRTYVSLECTNCPDVVQALNFMALVHDDFEHAMCDGGVLTDDIARLKIQGVPAVYVGDTLLHVGKSDIGQLLDLLEAQVGKRTNEVANNTLHNFDVVVLGGGPAGVASAIYSARKGLRVGLIAGRLGGQVNDTLGIENLIATPYTEGPKLANDLRTHLTNTGVTILEHRLVERIDDGGARKTVHLKGGERAECAQVIIATGAKWRELGVPGEREHIGRGVAFCPHCDGPFFKGKRVAVIGGGNSGVEAAIDLAGICQHVTLLEFGDALRADMVLQNKLRSLPNVEVFTEARTSEIIGNGSSVSAIRWENRATKEIHTKELDGVFVQIGLSPNSTMVKELVEVNRAGEIVVDARGRTSRAGIYAAGDVTTTPYKQIIIAMGEGAKTALTAFEDRMRQAA